MVSYQGVRGRLYEAVSHGSTHRFPAEHHTAELARLMTIPAVAERMARAPEVITKFDVPDLGGYSVDGERVYIDRGAKLDPVDVSGIVEHEHVEKVLIDVLGYSYAQAHEMATAAEHHIVQANNGDPKAYEERLKPFIKRAEHEKITNPPKDLDCRPYYEHPSVQDLKILARLAELGVVDARHEHQKLSHQAVKYGHGHKPEYCNMCEYFVVNGSHCKLVVDPIQPNGWCRLWKGKR